MSERTRRPCPFCPDLPEDRAFVGHLATHRAKDLAAAFAVEVSQVAALRAELDRLRGELRRAQGGSQ